MNKNGVGFMSLPSGSNKGTTTRQKIAVNQGEQGNFKYIFLDSIILTSFVIG